MISAHDRSLFTEGDCHVLAFELHRLTGWPMHSFLHEDGAPDVHVFVMMPDGRALDVDGPRPLTQLQRQYGRERHQPFSWPELLAEYGPRGSHRRAAHVAELLAVTQLS